MDQLSVENSVSQRSEKAADSRVVFINWPVQDGAYVSCDLTDGTDFSGAKIAFLDPLEFAVRHGFWTDRENIGNSEYTSFSEQQFKQYLRGVKLASQTLQLFLERGGMLVLRGNIPNAHIKVRRRSSSGSQTYTEAIVSSFFWLEEIIGGYSLQYCRQRTIKYQRRIHPLKKAFGECEVACLQTLHGVAKGQLETIATPGSSVARGAAVARIDLSPLSGQVFLIPQFIIPQEHVRLVEAFSQLAGADLAVGNRPAWVDDVEDDLDRISPYPAKIEQTERHIQALKRQSQGFRQNHGEILAPRRCAVRGQRGVAHSVHIALQLLGFEFSRQDHGPGNETCQTKIDKDTIRRADCPHDQPRRRGGRGRPCRRITVGGRIEQSQGHAEGDSGRKCLPGAAPSFRNSCFELEAITEASQADFCLMSTDELFEAVRYVVSRLGSDQMENIAASLRKDIIDCTGEFRLNRKKYAI